MPIIPVMKFGGTTLQGAFDKESPEYAELMELSRKEGDLERLYQAAAQRRIEVRAQRLKDVAQQFIIPHVREGRIPVVVTSAFGWATDKWKFLAEALSDKPDPREYARLQMAGELRSNSALALALRAMGYKAKSLTGREAGVRTTPQFVDAHVAEDLELRNINLMVAEGVIPVVAGFQGFFTDPTTQRNEVSILARGGSNLTAVALAWALDQRECCMYSDVDGLYDRPPEEPGAVLLAEAWAEDVLEMRPYPQVIQKEALRFALEKGVDIWIKNGAVAGRAGTRIICRRKGCLFA